VLKLLVRAPLRTAVRALVLAASAALLGAMVLFIGHSLRTMTGTAARSVSLDWQGPVGSAAAAQHVAAHVARLPGIATAQPVGTAPFAAASHRSAAGLIRSGAGSILAAPPGYERHLHTFRLLHGALQNGGIVLDQQLAATLQAGVGDLITLTPRNGAPPVSLRVTGIAVVTAADLLFQPLNPLAGPAPAQPPADIAIVPFATFVQRIAPALASIPASSAAAAAVPGAAQGVSWQVQAQVAPSELTGSPQHAYDLATRLRNRVERTLPGQVQFVDNLGNGLSGAAGDALYAEALYIMLAVPGALVGLGLAYVAALGAVERDRRMLRLLRARGASRRKLLALAAIESAVVGLVAGALGLLASLVAVDWLAGGDLSTWAWAVAVCFGVGFAGSFAGRVAAGVGALAEERRPKKPLWQKLYLDLVALAVSGLVWWLTARTGFSAVVSPDSNPTLSLSVYMFLAPALLWIGATLLLVRLRGRLFELISPRSARRQVDYLLVSAARRAPAVNRGLVVTALLLAFAVNLSLFTATWDQQAVVDARLTVGADVVVSGATGTEPLVAKTSGVIGTTALDHTYAYVGPDLQDTFGIDAKTFLHGTSLRDSFFLGGTAQQMLDRLRTRPDAVLVSKETVTDYSLALGDLLKLRTLDHRTGTFNVVPFHVVGIVQEFPSAPHDSFMVANRSYVLGVTHGSGPNVVFARTNASPSTVAHRVAAAVAPRGANVQNIDDQATQTASSITTVGLRGISRIEEAFALLLAAAALLLYVVVAAAERRQELATMAALGTPTRRIAAFIWTELALIVVVASALAALLGWLLAEMLIAMMQHAFDPPPDHLAAPWGFLGALLLVIVAGAALAALATSRTIRRLPLGAVLREE
jgi:putative ABC transport system permease protein